MRIYAACLASYNNGRIYGEWIDADQDADDIRADIAKMLRASPYPNVRVACPDCEGTGQCGESPTCSNCDGVGSVPSAEEYAIHDYDGIPSGAGEYPDIDKIAAYTEAVGDLSDEEREGFDAWMDNDSSREIDVDAFRESYRGCWPTFRDYAESFADDIGLLTDMPTNLSHYFDWDSWARDLKHDYTTHDGDHGVHVFDND